MEVIRNNNSFEYVSRTIRRIIAAVTRACPRASALPVARGLLLPLVLSAVAALAWVISLPRIPLSLMNDLGLVSVLPTLFFASLFLLNASFCLALAASRPDRRLLLLNLVLLIVMLHGVMSFLEDIPRFGPTWRHIGIVEYINRTGSVDARIDAYFNWPGFFILNAFVTGVIGANLIDYISWAPLAFNLLYLGPLWIIYSAFTKDLRLISLALWFFFIGNWVGQDYFSPQALNYFFHLAILSILLRWFNGTPPARNWARVGRPEALWTRLLRKVQSAMAANPLKNEKSTPFSQACMLMVALLLFLAMVPSHQLTPFNTLAAVTGLILFNRLSLRWLPVIMALLIALWISYMSVAYLTGHIDKLLGHVGQLGSSLDDNVTARLRGSDQHIFIVQLRLLTTLGLWFLAFLGVGRRWRKGHRDISVILLAIMPFPLLGLQSYGGEMMLRIYFFALPFTAFLAAAFCLPSQSMGLSRRNTLLIGLVALVLAGAFLFARYGNERMNTFTLAELEGMNFVYQTARPGSLLGTATFSLPHKFVNYEKYTFRKYTNEIYALDVNALIEQFEGPSIPQAYLILTRGQKAHVEKFYGVEPWFWDALDSALLASGRFEVVFVNEDTIIYGFTGNSDEIVQ
jgi:hypothetical protein